MHAAPVPRDEEARLRALYEYELLDTGPDSEFDDITQMAAEVSGYPLAFLTLLDAERQWFKCHVGVEATTTPRDVAFSAHAILQDGVFEIEDATLDPRFHDNPLVTGEPYVRAYAGAPLRVPSGEQVGVLCVVDRVPRRLDERGRRTLTRLAGQVVALMELRRHSAELRARALHLQHLAAVVERTTSPVMILDAARLIRWVNPAFERVTGYPGTQALGLHPAILFGYDAANAEAIGQLRAALDQGAPGFATLRLATRDKRDLWVDIDVQPTIQPDGSLGGFTVLGNDVTPRVAAESRQRRELAQGAVVNAAHRHVLAGQFDQALRLVTTAIGETSGAARVIVAETRPTEAPQGALDLLAVSRGPAHDARVSLTRARIVPAAAVHPDLAAAISTRSEVDLVAAAGEPWRWPQSGRRPGACRVVPVCVGAEVVAVLVLQAASTAAAPEASASLVQALADVVGSRERSRAREAARAAVRREQRRLQMALKASAVGVFELDLESGRLAWDARCADMHGVPGTAEWNLSEWAALVHDDDAHAGLDALVAAGSEGALGQSQCRIQRPDGTIAHVRINAQRFSLGGRQCVVGAMMDVTSDVELQRALNEERLRAESAARTEAEFLATMSHEIRTPMNGVLGMLELLLLDPLSAEQQERARMALDSGQSLLRILNDILDFSKLEARQVSLEAIPYDPARLMREAGELLAPRAHAKHLCLAYDLPPSLPEAVKGDPARIRQVLLNLVGNAIKFTTHGEIRLSLRHERAAGTETLLVQVQDTGEGIDEETQARLFSRFVQGDSSTSRRFGGTGLGLAICRQLMTLMQGDIGVTSRPGQGSTFWFRVPAPPCEVQARVPTATPASGPVASRAPQRLLAVDDNAVNRRLLQAFLRRAGHEVTLADSGPAALALLDGGPVDLVLMDIQMPVMDGVACARAIRARSDAHRDVPIIALTANAMPGDRERYLAAGFDGYLPKPVTLAALLEAIAVVQDRRVGDAADPALRRIPA